MIEDIHRSGLVLVTVLWVVAILSVIIAAAAYNSRLDTKVCMTGIDELKCRWACRAGYETASGVLNDDQRDSDCLTDLWNNNDEDFNNIELDDCVFIVKVVDESSKLNINTATKEKLMRLPDMTEEIADSIMDWRDKDNDKSPQGAEASYYTALEYGYEIRNGLFRTIRELLLVKGVTSEILYGKDSNSLGRLGGNKLFGNSVSSSVEKNGNLEKGWIEYLTCYSSDTNRDADGKKRININDADEKKLQNSLNIKKSQAKWIVENRNKKKYKSIADLIDEKSPKQAPKEDSNNAQQMDLDTFSKIADKITVTNSGRIRGRININTASEEVLMLLLGESEDSKKAIRGIINYRDSLAAGMNSIAEIMNADSVSIKMFKEIANSITTRSDVFSINCFAKTTRGTGETGRYMEAVVDRRIEPARILYWYEGVSY